MDTYQVAWATGLSECLGLSTPVPGLALVDVSDVVDRAQISITHVRSGAMIAAFGCAEAAVEMVNWLGDQSIDWTASGEQVQRRCGPSFLEGLETMKMTLGARSGVVGPLSLRRRVYSR